MKKIVCELCDSTEFVKEGGMFICQGCGTKYTAEEAKSMMKEVEGGSAVVGAPAGNPNQQQIENLLLLASNAYSASNNEETEKYCNRAIEYDAMCYKAWFLKAKAVGWSSTIQNPRIAEAAHSFKQAVDFAPDEEKESLTTEAVEELKRLGLACISLRQKRFSQYPDEEELNGFLSDIEHLTDGLVVLLSKEAEVAKADALSGLLGALNGFASIKFIGIKSKAVAAGVPKEYFSQIATMMGNAAIEGFNTAKRKYSNDTRPMRNDFKKTMDEVDNCGTLLDIAIDASDDDDDADIKRLNSKITMEEYVINMTAYDDYSSSYRSLSLTDEAKKNRRDAISNSRKKIQEIKDKAKVKAEEERKKAEEEKQARIKAYWEAHPEEKAKIEDELKGLNDKKSKLSADIASVEAEIQALQPNGVVPSETENNKIKDQIKSLENDRAKLGLFAGKQKKQITEEIAALNGRRDSLKAKIEAEKKARQAEADKKMSPLKEKESALRADLDKTTKKIAALEAELTKDPE